MLDCHTIALGKVGVLLLFTNMSLKSEHESDVVSTWNSNGCIYKQCPFMCKSIL